MTDVAWSNVICPFFRLHHRLQVVSLDVHTSFDIQTAEVKVADAIGFQVSICALHRVGVKPFLGCLETQRDCVVVHWRVTQRVRIVYSTMDHCMQS
eukprot:1045135-Amphidinium_carterae.1